VIIRAPHCGVTAPTFGPRLMSALPPKAHIADRREDVRSSLLFNFQLPALVRPRFAFARRGCVFEINCSNNGYLRQCGAEMIAPTWAEHRSLAEARVILRFRKCWSCETEKEIGLSEARTCRQHDG